MVINMLELIYFSYNSNIKCIDLTIKCINFKSIHYTINLGVVSSSMIFSDFDFMFPSIIASLNQ